VPALRVPPVNAEKEPGVTASPFAAVPVVTAKKVTSPLAGAFAPAETTDCRVVLLLMAFAILVATCAGLI
jgi:hypothetical protein